VLVPQRILRAMRTMMHFLLGIAVAGGQNAPEPRPRMAEEVFKNVQILKGIPVDEFMDTMGMISAALGMNCLDCHTGDSDASWDRFAAETELKRTSRRMMLMVNALNRDFLRGTRGVTCHTCHRGDLRPKIVANLALQYSAPVEDPNEVEIFPNPGGPDADQLFDKYFQALGGEQRLSTLTSFAARGTYTGYDTNRTKVPIEIFGKAPDQRTAIVHTAFADRVTTYDGRAGWIAAIEKPLPLLPLTGGNLDGARIEAILSFPLQIRQALKEWQVGSTIIDDREVQVLQGTNAGRPPVNFYFDDSGLLVRLVRFVDTPIGRVPTQIDFADYREVSGIKMPFRWTSTWTDGQATVELSEVQTNVSIDAAKFARPAPARPRPQ
jgi:photosynthetic reaction center cytochrome c subunit